MDILDSSEEASRTMASHQQSILAENRELRKRLEEQQTIYRRKLAGFQDNQQRQTQLVVQYKEKCQDLEFKLQLLDNEAKTRRAECESNIAELESMTMRLEEEQQRATTLSTVNGMLRDQMDQAQMQNKFLASENAKLHDELVEIQHSCDRRATQWQEDEAAMNELISKQHDRLIGLWKEVSSVRRQVSELKVGLQDHVNEAKSEIGQAMRSCSLAGEKLTNRLKAQIENLKHEVETEHANRMKSEQKLHELTAEMDAARLRFEDSASAHARQLKDLSRQTESLQAELSDRDKALTCLQQLRTGQTRCTTGLAVGESPATTERGLRWITINRPVHLTKR
ncbi:unnamed protein product [Schistocephalus solidus]|uniref:Alpha-helical coiled-coil rod protein n=1 Tax=Schistocephalus solidus TaxID=70667 RepID=A0A183T057_SCHSO|nr:unnamed protein product [Schistocephalus solidus]